MRSYRTNSAQAAARIAAFAALSDGHFCGRELDAMQKLQIQGSPGLTRDQLLEIVQHLSEDLMATAPGGQAASWPFDDAILEALMSEVTDPGLRRATLALCAEVTLSDAHMADAESRFVELARQRWQCAAASTASHSPTP